MKSTNEFDTSTTAGKIAVMQAAEFGLKIEERFFPSEEPGDFPKWNSVINPLWSWDDSDYRIALGQQDKLAQFRSHLGAMEVGLSWMRATRGGLEDERDCGMNKVAHAAEE